MVVVQRAATPMGTTVPADLLQQPADGRQRVHGKESFDLGLGSAAASLSTAGGHRRRSAGAADFRTPPPFDRLVDLVRIRCVVGRS